MEITWYGHSCFRFVERGMATVVTDPFDSKVAGYNPLKLKADIVTVSSNDLSHNNVSVIRPEPFVIDGPGEYERGGAFLSRVSKLIHSLPIKKVNAQYLVCI